MKLLEIVLFIICCAIPVCGQVLGPFRDADIQLYSGDVLWTAEFESMQPVAPPSADKMLVGLSRDAFEAWVKKFDGPRKQTFQIRCLFQGDYLRFECYSEAGDICPVVCDRVIAYNGVAIAFMDRDLKNMYRESWPASFRENHFATFYTPPRACGYGVDDVMRLVRNIKGINGQTGTVSVTLDEKDKNKIVVVGTFPAGTLTVAEFVADDQHGNIFSSIKFINPAFGERVIIEATELTAYEKETIFPRRTVVTRYSGGNLDDLSNSPIVDRMTLIVQKAEFNGPFSDELFNPACPNDYTDLLDLRLKKKFALESNPK
ncbi:MAG: hypothetical protein C4527_27965 [Candidatus Omnitrophota bacterium]|jgi:hypothetical protein|nr:MAG: hypothetical protein C4527_27965 [Candidatus Omnitrophota bacterium]